MRCTFNALKVGVDRICICIVCCVYDQGLVVRLLTLCSNFSSDMSLCFTKTATTKYR